MNHSPGSNPSPEGCPTYDTLRAFVHGRLGEEVVLQITAHLYMQCCPRCSEILLAMPDTTASVLSPITPSLPIDPEQPTDEARLETAAMQSRQNGYQPLRLGRYSIRGQIGKGGFGTVYAAHDEELDRVVAIKVPFAHRLSVGEQQHASAEARLHASLDHPNIVPIYDVGRTEEIPFFFVSKLIVGKDLAARLRAERPGFRESAHVVLLVAGALEHMHKRGLVHRDVKPRNILLDKEGKPYLADFGLAMHPVPAGDEGAEDNLIAGTLAYMSPEQARGESRRLDHRTDVYALGVVLFELLTGEKPFRGDIAELRNKILNEAPPAPASHEPGVPGDLEAICLKAMAKDVNRRYQDAGQLAEDLRRFLADEPLRYARDVGAGEWIWWWLRRHRAQAAMAAALVLVLVASLLPWRSPIVPPPPPPEKTETVLIQTDPPGASLSFFPLDRETGAVRIDKVVRGKAGEEVRVVPGRNLVVAVLPGEPLRFHEVYRLVPGSGARPSGPFTQEISKYIDGVYHLPKITIPPADVADRMCLVPGTDAFAMGDVKLKVGDLDLAPPHTRRIPAFRLDTAEVTVEEYNRLIQFGRPEGEWIPMSGRRDHPVANVRWDQAVGWAERRGKRLLDEAEFEYAATNLGKSRFPWGDELHEPLKSKLWQFGPVGTPTYDRLRIEGQPDVCGLYSNVAEWTSSWPASGPGGLAEPETRLRVIRGGPFTVVDGKEAVGVLLGPRERCAMVVPENRPGLGFRCARSAKPRLRAEDFVTILGR